MRIKLGTHSHYEDQGTDIYVKKIDQGAGYGAGYHVEVYDFGQKVDEQIVSTKKDVRRMIDEQKAKYTTDRAFEEGSHLFVSYRIDDIESKKFKQQHHLTGKESAMNTDDKLYKQAARINNLLSTVKDPEVPLKFFKQAEQLFDFNGEGSAPQASAEAPAAAPVSEKDSVEDTAQQISEKIDAYLNSMQSGPRDDIFNDLEKFMSTIKTILDGAGYTAEERSAIINTLVTKYKNSGIPNADLLMRNAKNSNRLRRAGPIISAPIQSDVLNNSVSQNSTLTPLGTNATPGASNNTGSGDFNSATDTPDNGSLSTEAQTAVQKLNTMDENDIQGRFDFVNNLPNKDSILNEIQKKQMPTSAENNMTNYQADYAAGLYKFAGEEIAKFYKHATAQKGVTSFNKSFTKWASVNKYSKLQSAIINMRKASFIETANYQLKNNGALPENFEQRQASERVITHYLVKLSVFEQGGEKAEVSDKFVYLLKTIFYDKAKTLQPAADAAVAEEEANRIISTIPEYNFAGAMAEVCGFYIAERLRPYFTTAWMQHRKEINPKLSSYTMLFDEFWSVMQQNQKSSIIAQELKPFIGELLAQTTQDSSKLYPAASMTLGYVHKSLATILSACLDDPACLTTGWAEGKAIAAHSWAAEDKPVNAIKPAIYGSKKTAVNITINESPNGASEVSVDNGAGEVSTFNEPAPAALPDQNPGQDDVNTEDNLFGDAGAPQEPNAQAAPVGDDPSLFDELNI
jgi:hypothetical protein